MLKRSGKVAIAKINSASSISFGLMSDQIYLTQYGLMAERHWRVFRTPINGAIACFARPHPSPKRIGEVPLNQMRLKSL